MHISGSTTDPWCNQTLKSAIKKDSAVFERFLSLTKAWHRLVIDVYN
jgi:hypothetical protein